LRLRTRRSGSPWAESRAGVVVGFWFAGDGMRAAISAPTISTTPVVLAHFHRADRGRAAIRHARRGSTLNFGIVTVFGVSPAASSPRSDRALSISNGYQSARHMLRFGRRRGLMGTGGVMAFGLYRAGAERACRRWRCVIRAVAGIMLGTAGGLRGALPRAAAGGR